MKQSSTDTETTTHTRTRFRFFVPQLCDTLALLAVSVSSRNEGDNFPSFIMITNMHRYIIINAVLLYTATSHRLVLKKKKNMLSNM